MKKEKRITAVLWRVLLLGSMALLKPSSAFAYSQIPFRNNDEVWSCDFEDAEKVIGVGNELKTFTLCGIEWTSYGVSYNLNRFDYADGKGSARISGRFKNMTNMPFLEMTQPKKGGIGVVRFTYRALSDYSDKLNQTDWIIQVKVEEQEGWQTLGVPFTPTQEVQTYLVTCNIPEGRLRFVRADYETFDYASNTHYDQCFNMDNLSISNATVAPPDQPDIAFEQGEFFFGKVLKGEQQNIEIPFSYRHLTEDINFTLSDADAPFTVSPSSFPLQDGESSGKLRVTYAPTSYGTHAVTLVARSGDVEKSLSLRGECARPEGPFSYSGGSGTKEAPYLLTTAEDIEDLSIAVNEKKLTYNGEYFKMTADIDMSSVIGMHPIGNNFGTAGAEIKTFEGFFDGDGHKITGLRMVFAGKNNIGVALFGVTRGASISNLTLEECTFSADALAAPFMAVAMGGKITNCHTGQGVEVKCSVQGFAGGLVCGVMESPLQIIDCSSSSKVYANNIAGGILANSAVSSTKLIRCMNYGAVEASHAYSGGLVGYVESGDLAIEDCANLGYISAPYERSTGGTGGLIGLVSPTHYHAVILKNCYNAGKISVSGNDVDPITVTRYSQQTDFQISNCYYNTDLWPDEADNGNGLSTNEMRSKDFARMLNADREKGPWVSNVSICDGYPVSNGTEDETDPPAEKELELVQNEITVPQYAFYRVFIKGYTPEIWDYLSNNKRVVVEYESLSEDVVESYGNQFKTLTTGVADVKVKVSPPKGGTNDTFDPANVLGEATVRVNVVDHIDPQFIPFNTSWGMIKADAVTKQQKEYNHELFTENYWKMHPAVDESLRNGVEVFYTGNFEFPVSILYFSEGDELVGTSFMVASWERVRVPEVTPIAKHLKQLGYTFLGINGETGEWEMYNDETKSLATVCMVYMQSQSYYSCNITYTPENPSAKKTVADTYPEITISTEDSAIKVKAPGCVGEPLLLYATDGSQIYKGTLSDEESCIPIDNQGGVFLLKIGDKLPVKIIL